MLAIDFLFTFLMTLSNTNRDNSEISTIIIIVLLHITSSYKILNSLKIVFLKPKQKAIVGFIYQIYVFVLDTPLPLPTIS